MSAVSPVYPTKSSRARAICDARWEGKGLTPKRDPCGGRPLYGPCVQNSTTRNLEEFSAWVGRINALAEKCEA
jgi:hypothetical protein